MTPPTASRLWSVVLAIALFPGSADAQDDVWRLVDEFRFAGSAELPLGSVDRLVPGPDGSVYVAGRGDVAIHVLGPDGGYDGAIGRIGDGPGEFRISPNIGIRADTLWALDRLLRRVSRFGLTGDLIDTRSFPAVRSGKAFLLDAHALLADGTLLLLESITSDWTGEDLSRGQEVRVLSIDGEDGGSVARLEVSTIWLRFALPGDVMMATQQPWSTHDLLAVSPRGDGFVVVAGRGTDEEEGSYTLTWFDTEGRPTRSASVAVRAARLSRDEIDSFREGMAEGLAARMNWDVASARRTLSDSLYTPDYLPAVESMTRSLSAGAVLWGPDGTTWVRHRDIEGARWLVFDTSGERIADVEAPDDLVIHHVGTDHVWGVWEDALDIPHVYRYRLRKERGPAPDDA